MNTEQWEVVEDYSDGGYTVWQGEREVARGIMDRKEAELIAAAPEMAKAMTNWGLNLTQI